MKMLQSLNALAGKISPGSPTDSNANKVHMHNNNNNNNVIHHHPYSKQQAQPSPSHSANGDQKENSVMNNNSVEQPDPDNIKMFVGQVPHDMDENDLRTMFEEYGRVHQINILRDKITGSHREKKKENREPESKIASHENLISECRRACNPAVTKI